MGPRVYSVSRTDAWGTRPLDRNSRLPPSFLRPPQHPPEQLVHRPRLVLARPAAAGTRPSRPPPSAGRRSVGELDRPLRVPVAEHQVRAVAVDARDLPLRTPAGASRSSAAATRPAPAAGRSGRAAPGGSRPASSGRGRGPAGGRPRSAASGPARSRAAGTPATADRRSPPARVLQRLLLQRPHGVFQQLAVQLVADGRDVPALLVPEDVARPRGSPGRAGRS